VHIFNYDQLSWSTQQISADGTDPTTLDAILDRDTNVFFALSNSQLYQLQMGALTQANGSTLGWEYVDAPAFAQNSAYTRPVMALAQNHIYFLNVGQAAEVAIFVIHYAFMQPNLQTFAPLENGGQGFPSVHGETASIFKGFSEVQQQFAFIPDDGSATYIFDAIVRGFHFRRVRWTDPSLPGEHHAKDPGPDKWINGDDCCEPTGACTNDNVWKGLLDPYQPEQLSGELRCHLEPNYATHFTPVP
jgi:hypothetical protein